MSFKKIEINGFKTFADKTTIPVQNGLTCIVGPNGSGKSNVVEAVRWVLGEQSAKGLRSSNMHEVIFHGTETRRSQSYCEVSLYFDNSDRTFEDDREEISFTRRIDRSSGSGEYYINNNRCRLQDITNMLYNTGISRSGYTIIGQGKVQEIILAKPEDRRIIFEDAAGVAKFKKQKNDTQRDLEKAAEKISRLNDIANEIKNRLAPLEKQANVARKYNELSEELKFYEVNYYVHKYETNKATVDAITTKLNEATYNYKQAEAESQQVLIDYETRNKELTLIDDELSKLNDELTLLKVSAEKSEGEGRLQVERIEKFRGEVGRIEQEIERINREVSIRQFQIDDNNAKKLQRTQELVALQKDYEEASSKLSDLSKKLSTGEDSIAASNNRIYASMEQLAEIKSNYGQILAEKNIHVERLVGLKEGLLTKKNNLDSEVVDCAILDGNIRKYKFEGQALTQRKSELLADKNEKRQSLITFKDDVNKLNTRIGNLEGRKVTLINMKNNFAFYGESVKNLMKDSKSNPELSRRIDALVAEVVSIQPEYVVAIEQALGGALQNIITKDEYDIKFLIDYLKTKGYFKVTFLPLNSYRGYTIPPEARKLTQEHGVEGFASEFVECNPKYRNIINGLLGSTVIVNNIETAIRISRTYNYGFRLVTLDGDIVNTSGAYTGGAKKQSENNILGLDNDIAECNASLDKASRQLKQLELLAGEAEKDIAAAETELETVSIEIENKKESIIVAQTKQVKLQENIEEHTAEVKSIATEVDSITQSIKEAEEKLNSVDKLEEDIRQQKSVSGELAEKTKTEFELNRKERETIVAREGDLRVKIAETKREIEQIDAEIYRIKTENDKLNESLIDNDSLLKSNKALLDNAEMNAVKANVSVTDRAGIEKKEAERNELVGKKRQYQQELSSLESRRVELGEQSKKYNEERFRQQSALEKTDSDMQYMHEHIWEDYQLTYQNAAAIRAEEFDPTTAQGNINRLRKSINQLGPVNPNAIADYEENFKRHEEHLVQLEDLSKARADLEKIIADLTADMEEKFNTAFEQINKNFDETFRELFGGGSASLKLDKSKTTDPLDAGVEIMAKPRGKTPINLSQLSGGEQSLTAIAILFAILKLKPMPFCILDEIDTALDPSNAKLLAEYIKKMSDKTQFLMVTHKSVTMELADQLYGVTQVESGVSRGVTVMLTEALKFVKEENK